MNLTSAEKDGQLHIAVRMRRIDAGNATIFKDRLRGMILSAGLPAVLDMRQVWFMDSSGLGALIAVQNAAVSGIKLQNLTPDVARVFRVTGLEGVFDPASTDQDWINSTAPAKDNGHPENHQMPR